MDARTTASYDPRTFRALTFHDATPRFRDGSDSPRAYLERCLDTVESREPIVKAFAATNVPAARAAADQSSARWKANRPLSAIDGLPIGIKDLLETKDMPTELGCEAYKGNFPKRDNAAVWALRQAGAVILAKTTTAELGGSHPPATTNPFDPRAPPAARPRARPLQSPRACCRRRSAPRSAARSSAPPPTAATLRSNPRRAASTAASGRRPA